MASARGSHKGEARERSLVSAVLLVAVRAMGLLPSIWWGPLVGKAYSWEEELKEEWKKESGKKPGQARTDWAPLHLALIPSAWRDLQRVMAAGSLLPAPSCTRSSFGPALTWSHTGNVVPSFLELTVDAPSSTPCELARRTCWLLSDYDRSFHAGVFAVYVLCLPGGFFCPS